MSTARSTRAPTVVVRTDFPAVQRQCASAQRVTAMMTLTAPQLEQVDDRRSGLTVSVAVDVSGSMGGERLALAIETLKFIVGELKATDELGIIAYDTHVTERLALTAMDSAGKARACAVSDSLQAGSSTNLCGGLLAGVDQAVGRPFDAGKFAYASQDRRSPPHTAIPPCGARDDVVECREASNRIRAVLLLTDGQANHGPQTTEAIVTELQRALSGGASVAVHTFGFGSDHNADLLRAISEVTQGSYYFIGVADQIKEAFANCLGGLVSVVMQRIVVRCRATGEGVRVLRALTKYPTTTLPDGAVEVRMADLYSGEARDTLVELEVAALATASGPTDVARWSVVYDDTVSGARGAEAGASTMVAFHDDEGRGEADVRVDEQRRRLEVVQALEEARGLASGGDLEQARAVLQHTRAALASSASVGTEYVQGLARECAVVEGVLRSKREWEERGAKVTNMSAQRHAQQRSNAVSADECDAYATPFQTSMKARARKV